MPKKKAQPEKWPFRIRGLYVVLGASLLVNAITLSFIGFLNSKQADGALYAHTTTMLCQRDYDEIMERLRKAGNTDATKAFSEALCGRDSNNGTSL